MRKPLSFILSSIFIALFFILISIKQSHAYQKEGLSISLTGKQAVIGTAQGDNLLQLKGHTLSQIVNTIKPQTSVAVDSRSLENTLFDFEYRGDLTDKQKILDQLNSSLQSELGISVEIAAEKPKVYTLEFNGQSGCNEPGVINRQTETNSYWEAGCMELSAIADKIHEWYGTLFYIDDSTVVVPTVKLSKVSFDGMKMGLKDAQLNLVLDKEASNTSKTYVYSR